jgi:peptide/nickel transport system permease protein
MYVFSSKTRRNGPAILAVGVLLAIGLASVFAGRLVTDPLSQNLDAALLSPFTAGHLLGTDHLGRDVLSRLLYGARNSLLVSVGSAGGAAVLGTTVGTISAIDRRGVLDRLLQIGNDAILAFPTILLAITVAVVFSPGRYQVTLTLAIVFSPVLYRVSRIEARRVIQRDFYQVSRMIGTRPATRIVLHILPNVVPQILVQSASLAAIAIGTEAALSFLGLGTQPPHPSWGLMLNDARRYMAQAPRLSIFPGIATGALAFCFQYLSDDLAARFHLRE